MIIIDNSIKFKFIIKGFVKTIYKKCKYSLKTILKYSSEFVPSMHARNNKYQHMSNLILKK